jgi:hypothetical protein
MRGAPSARRGSCRGQADGCRALCAGTRRGPKALVDLEDVARRSGYAAIRLETGIRQPEAIRLYESSGYRCIAAYSESVDSPISVCFEKSLTSP